MTTDPHTGILGSGAARALVLGSGGLTGIAWATGLLLGLERLGLRYSLSGLIVGTSAGSAVAAQLSGPTSLEELYQAQLDGRVAELPGALGPRGILRLVLALRGTDERKALTRVGALALGARTVAVPLRRAVIEQRLPVHE